MNRNEAIEKYFILTVIAAGLFCLLSVTTIAQKSEHYNSPLYAPKTYDPSQAVSATGLPDALKKIGIEQKLGDTMPLDSVFTDEDGKEVKLGDYFSKDRPVILAFVYYECPMLCNQVLNGLTGSLKSLPMSAGKDFEVVAISFDKRENGKPELAKNKKASYLERYGRPGSEDGWHFLTGSEASIDVTTKAAGFGFEWDEKSGQFAHASGVMIVTPEGKLSKYFYGIDYAPNDLKFGLIESADHKVGSTADKLLLFCYHYDPASGKYGLEILKVVRIGAVATILGMGLMGFVFWRRNKAKKEV